MRFVRTLLVVLIAVSGLDWGLPAATASGATPARPPVNPSAPASSATIQVTVEGDQYDDPNDPGAPGSGCSLRQALQLTFNDGNRGCGATINGATDISMRRPASPVRCSTRPRVGGSPPPRCHLP